MSIKYNYSSDHKGAIAIYYTINGPKVAITYTWHCKGCKCHTNRIIYPDKLTFEEWDDLKCDGFEEYGEDGLKDSSIHMSSKATYFSDELLDDCFRWWMQGTPTQAVVDNYNKRCEKAIKKLDRSVGLRGQGFGVRGKVGVSADGGRGKKGQEEKEGTSALTRNRLVEAVFLRRLERAIRKDIGSNVELKLSDVEEYAKYTQQ